MKIKTESFLIKFFRKLGFDSIAWSLRRLYCPVKKTDLVLEIGSGGNPYFRANILCDAYFETVERHFEPLIYDRPTILAFAENLPFKDNSFDFIIASHVLEHSTDPDKFLNEIQRVAKAGYIEVPDAFFERVCSYPIHRLEIREENNQLVIYKKTSSVEDKYLNELFSNKASKVFPELVSKKPFNFHIRYYWSKDDGGIKYKILNPDYKFDWDLPNVGKEEMSAISLKNKIRKILIFLIRKLFSQNRRNGNIDLSGYLKCIKCGNDKLEGNSEFVRCLNCRQNYKIINNNIIDFINL